MQWRCAFAQWNAFDRPFDDTSDLFLRVSPSYVAGTAGRTSSPFSSRLALPRWARIIALAATSWIAFLFMSLLSFDRATADGGAELRSVLARDGWVLVRGVVTEAEARAWGAQLKEFIGSLSHGGDSSWVQDCIFEGFGAGHATPCWEARLHSRVRAVFAALWQTSQLVTSVDAFCAERPRDRARSAEEAVELHLDQNVFRESFDAVQGALSLSATRQDTGGTTVVGGSHAHASRLLRERFAGELGEQELNPSLNWHVLSPQARKCLLDTPGCQLVHVETEPGDLMLWDSRTVHCGRKARAPQPHDAWRLAIYICMWPATRLTPEHRAAKQRALGLGPDGTPSSSERAETTTHWPDGRELKPRYGWPADGSAPACERPPQAVSDGVLCAPACARTPEALRLAGVLPYDEE